MALYFSFNRKIDNNRDGFTWHIGEGIPFFPLATLESIQADGHEKEYLQSLHVPHSMFGGKAAMDRSEISTYNRDCALVIYGMMIGEQAKRKFG